MKYIKKVGIFLMPHTLLILICCATLNLNGEYETAAITTGLLGGAVGIVADAGLNYLSSTFKLGNFAHCAALACTWVLVGPALSKAWGKNTLTSFAPNLSYPDEPTRNAMLVGQTIYILGATATTLFLPPLPLILGNHWEKRSITAGISFFCRMVGILIMTKLIPCPEE